MEDYKCQNCYRSFKVDKADGFECPLCKTPQKPKKSKYCNNRTMANGVAYHSKKEAKFALELDILKKLGEVKYWLEQIPIKLPGKVKYLIDFQVFYSDGSVKYIDVKGFSTQIYKMKKKQVEELYPIKITEI